MANLAATIREEIQRLARKEIKARTGSTKQAVLVATRYEPTGVREL